MRASPGTGPAVMDHKKLRIVDVVELPVQNEKSGSFIARVREVIKVIRAEHSPKHTQTIHDPSECPLEFHKRDRE
jgi:hypothetical protein